MTRDKENSGAAWPSVVSSDVADGRAIEESGWGGLSAREYAAIHTGTPDSGCDWIDEMIRKKVRREAAVRIMAGLCSFDSDELFDLGEVLDSATGIADFLIAELGGEG